MCHQNVADPYAWHILNPQMGIIWAHIWVTHIWMTHIWVAPFWVTHICPYYTPVFEYYGHVQYYTHIWTPGRTRRQTIELGIFVRSLAFSSPSFLWLSPWWSLRLVLSAIFRLVVQSAPTDSRKSPDSSLRRVAQGFSTWSSWHIVAVRALGLGFVAYRSCSGARPGFRNIS